MTTPARPDPALRAFGLVVSLGLPSSALASEAPPEEERKRKDQLIATWLPQQIKINDAITNAQQALAENQGTLTAGAVTTAATFGEVWVGPTERFARYLRPDELHFAFHFALTGAPFDARALRVPAMEALRPGTTSCSRAGPPAAVDGHALRAGQRHAGAGRVVHRRRHDRTPSGRHGP